MKPANTEAFAAETDLCKAFMDAIGHEWTPYAETAGYDILLVRNADGFQISVQAKLKLNAVALSQALEGSSWEYSKMGPDCRAVLVPYGAAVAGVAELADRLAVTVIRMETPRFGKSFSPSFSPRLPTPDERYYCRNDGWHELCPLERHSLPDYVPDVAAGASGPTQLTDWKIKAIKIAVICEILGFVTRADFKALRIDPRRWIDARWMLPCEQGFKLSDQDWMKKQHPRVYEEIKAKHEEWMPPPPPLLKAARSA